MAKWPPRGATASSPSTWFAYDVKAHGDDRLAYPINLRITERMLAEVSAFGNAHRLDLSASVRHLIGEGLKVERRKARRKAAQR